MVWGCFGNNKPGHLIKIDGKLNKEGYLKILQEIAIPSGMNLIGRCFIFQQDNDPKHSSKLYKGFLEQKRNEEILQIMKWPSQSPDLSPIELVWAELDRKVKNRCPSSSSQMWEYLQSEWQSLDSEYFGKLFKRMSKICEQVIKNKCGHFDEAKI